MTPLKQRCSALSAGALAVLVGGLVLLGWALDIAWLKSVLPGWVSMKPNTAVAFTLTGIALLASSTPGTQPSTHLSRLSRYCALFAGLIGLLSLCEYAFGWNPGFDQWLFPEPAGTVGTSHPGRMAPDTALCFMLFAAGWEFARRPLPTNRTLGASLLFGTAMTTLALIEILSYFTPGLRTFGWGGLTMMALPTATVFAALGVTLLLAARTESASPAQATGRADAGTGLKFILVFIALAIGIIATGTFYYRNYERQFRGEAEQQLAAIASLKVGELEQYRRERLGDAAILNNNPAFTQLVRRFLASPADANAQRQLQAWLGNVQEHYQYDKVFLLDVQGVTRLSLPARLSPISSDMARESSEVLRSGQAKFQDFYLDEHDQRIYLSLLVPVRDEADGNRPLGVIVLRIDPTIYLYPFLSNWPVPSATAETLLVRREGNEAVFLNDLRFQKNTALTLRSSLANTAMPAVKAALGQEGIVSGRDYRGVPVLAALRTVPNSPWFLVARRDIAEVYAPLRSQLWQVVVIVGVLIFGAAAGVGIVWRQQQVRFYREKTEAGKALLESNDLLELFVRNSPIFTYIKSVTPNKSRVLRASDNFREMIGISGSDMAGKTMEELFPADMAAKMTADDWAVITKGEMLRVDEELNGRNYTTIKFPLILRDRVLLAGYTTDITESKQAEQALRESEEKYRTLMTNLSSGVVVHAPDTSVIFSNPMASTLLGLTKDQMRGKEAIDPAWYFLRENDMAMPLAEYPVNRVLSSGEPIVNQVLGICRPDLAEPVWVQYNAYPDTAVDGTLLQVIVTFSDITERKLSISALQEANSKIQASQKATLNILEDLRLEIQTRMVQEAELKKVSTAIEQAGEMIIITDPAGKIEYVNPAFATVSGYSSEEVIGKTPALLKSGQQDKAFYQNLWETITSGQVWHGRLVNKRKDGRLYTEEVSISPVFDAAGKIINYVGVKRDITAELALTAQFQQAQKMESVGRLAGGVAHDYNNMLSVILGYTEMALEKVAPSDPLHKDLQQVFDAARRSTDITRQLLAFARKQAIAPVVLDLNATVDGMLQMLRRLIGEDISLAWLPAFEVWPVKIDPSQLDQILANLCVNGRDAIDGVGKVTIETANVIFDDAYCARNVGLTPGAFVMLAVSDNGCGMDKNTLEQIFEPFFTTKEIGKGTGLGLATVYGIVKQNRGFVNVYSEPGNGTTFKIYIPRETTGIIETKDARATELFLGRGETILLVEDESTLLVMAQRLLESLGYTVLSAVGPGDAFRMAEDHLGEIHLLLTDVIMPEMNGRDLAHRLAALCPSMKHLFMSGYTADVITHQGILDEGVHFIQKPLSKKDLAAKVRKILDTKGASSASENVLSPAS